MLWFWWMIKYASPCFLKAKPRFGVEQIDLILDWSNAFKPQPYCSCSNCTNLIQWLSRRAQKPFSKPGMIDRGVSSHSDDIIKSLCKCSCANPGWYEQKGGCVIWDEWIDPYGCVLGILYLISEEGDGYSPSTDTLKKLSANYQPIHLSGSGDIFLLLSLFLSFTFYLHLPNTCTPPIPPSLSH